jgi:hypothetical protein
MGLQSGEPGSSSETSEGTGIEKGQEGTMNAHGAQFEDNSDMECSTAAAAATAAAK